MLHFPHLIQESNININTNINSNINTNINTKMDTLLNPPYPMTYNYEKRETLRLREASSSVKLQLPMIMFIMGSRSGSIINKE